MFYFLCGFEHNYLLCLHNKHYISKSHYSHREVVWVDIKRPGLSHQSPGVQSHLWLGSGNKRTLGISVICEKKSVHEILTTVNLRFVYMILYVYETPEYLLHGPLYEIFLSTYLLLSRVIPTYIYIYNLLHMVGLI